MLVDITLKITPSMVAAAQGHEKMALAGHLGTHFDVMDKEFPLKFTQRSGVVFDVSGIRGRDIDVQDVALDEAGQDMFVAFHTGFIEAVGYGEKAYFTDHPQLSTQLIDALIQKGVSIIGIDFAGVRRGKEHSVQDQRCADRGVFIVENLCGLKALVERGSKFTAFTYPMNYAQMTGLPCRVVAQV